MVAQVAASLAVLVLEELVEVAEVEYIGPDLPAAAPRNALCRALAMRQRHLPAAWRHLACSAYRACIALAAVRPA